MNMPSIIIRDIDADLRKRFRLLCVQDEISMNVKLKQILREYVEKREKAARS